MRDDAAARERALDPQSSFIVQAPAGSGKTELLIQRYLRLLETVESPHAVVAITFTKKAAGEMRARVMQALRRTEPPEQEHERVTHAIAQRVVAHQQRLGWDLVSNPSQIRMETIDALCASITRQMPWMARFGAPPEITEKAGPLYRAAARRTLHHLEAEERSGVAGPVWDLLLHLDNNYQRAETLIAERLEKRDQWLRLLGWSEERDYPAIRRLFEERLARLIEAHLEEIHAHFDPEFAAAVSRWLGWPAFPSPRLAELPRWRTLYAELLTQAGKFRKDACRKFPALEEREPLKRALRAVAKLPEPVYTDAQWRLTESILQVLPVAVAELQMVFRERGMVDFAELSIRALHALGELTEPSDLALAMGERIEHLLVDEFQDTSFTQFELLEKLTAGWEPGDGRTLFLVGDPMQSIYRFRQADVSLFLRARDSGIGNLRLEPLQLRRNFRSCPSLIAFVNHACGQAFPAEHNMEKGAVAYSESYAGMDDDGSQSVHCYAFLDQEAEALKTLELLRNVPHNGTAILVRARGHLVQIVKLLRRQGILFQAVEIDSMGERPVIQDLLALTYALLHPADRISWLAVLRAPWCGLTLADLHATAGSDQRRPVWDLLANATLSEDGRERVSRIRPVLEEALGNKGRAPLRDWVEETWHRLGGSACARGDADLEDAAAYFELLETVDEGGDLADFGAFREDVGNLFAQPDPRAQGGLQVMTIHKAKGLEFDTVIVPGMGQPPRREESVLLRWVERGGELVLAPISAVGEKEDPIFVYLGYWEQVKIRHETCRLLYVAMTRARRELHMLGCVTIHTAQGVIAKPDSFLKALWPAVSGLFQPAPNPTSAQPSIAAAREIRRVVRGWTVPEIASPVYSVPVLPASAEPVSYEWVGDTLRHVGTAVHQYLQRMGRDRLQWDAARVRSLRDAYRSVLANLGVPPGELPEAVTRVESGLLAVLADARGRWILSPHPEAECEYPLTGMIDGRRYDAVIDRTFVAEGVRWVIDYKTSQHLGGKLEKFYDQQVERYRDQLEIYSRLLRQREERPVKLALYFPLLGGWREWDGADLTRRQARFAF
jgi:ATP-dependent helicase/nuclease subunit A